MLFPLNDGQIERTAKAGFEIISSCCVRNCLEFSIGKSDYLTLRAKARTNNQNEWSFDQGHPVDGAVVADVRSSGRRKPGLLRGMRRTSESVWHNASGGYPMCRHFPVAFAIQSSVFCVMGHLLVRLTYTDACWYSWSCLHVVQSALIRTQRPSLILLIKA